MDYDKFKRTLYVEKKFDLDAYKDCRMQRRISTLMDKHGFEGYADYIQAIIDDSFHFEQLLDYITINTTHFFRNPNHFEYLAQTILPKLYKKTHTLKCWSAACSNGAEPYSLSMLLLENFPGKDFEILATDIDPNILEDARGGLYSNNKLRELNSKQKETYFEQKEDTFCVKPLVRESVSFKVHDLFKDAFPKGQNLILCRNFFIYLKSEAKRELVEKFHEALDTEGVLFTGNTEYIADISKLGFKKVVPSFFRRSLT